MHAELIKNETGEVIAGREPITILPDTTPKRIDCAFTTEGKSNLDSVFINVKGRRQEVIIPSVPFVGYWGIIRYMYLNHSRKVYNDELCRGVQRLMMEASPTRWEKFINKKVVASGRKGRTIRQQPNAWNRRLITNMRNLCRVGNSPNAYGRRLFALGHVMRYETDATGRGYCILYLEMTPENMAPRKRGRKKRDDSMLLALPEDIQQMIRDGVIDKNAGFLLLTIDPDEQRAVIEQVRREYEQSKEPAKENANLVDG